MSKNHYFQFKKFGIDQTDCGMRVTTEACIFGALIDTKTAQSILDIGTGTGLLSLMLAQRSHSAKIIHGVELDENAALASKNNFENSPWKDQLTLFPGKIQQHQPDFKYDLIVCNPPFFKNALKGQTAARNKAIHEETLNQLELAESIQNLLSTKGEFWVLYPPREFDQFQKNMESFGFHLHQKWGLHDHSKAPLLRNIGCFTRVTTDEVVLNRLEIKSGNDYTPAFKLLLKDFYLAL